MMISKYHSHAMALLFSRWRLGVLPPELGLTTDVTHTFSLNGVFLDTDNVTVGLRTSYPGNLPLLVSFQLFNKTFNNGLVWAGVISVAMYLGIIFEVAHR